MTFLFGVALGAVEPLLAAWRADGHLGIEDVLAAKSWSGSARVLHEGGLAHTTCCDFESASSSLPVVTQTCLEDNVHADGRSRQSERRSV